MQMLAIGLIGKRDDDDDEATGFDRISYQAKIESTWKFNAHPIGDVERRRFIANS